MTFSCPHCDAKLDAKPKTIGKRIKCPSCRKPITVPAAEQTAAMQVGAPQDSQATDPDGNVFYTMKFVRGLNLGQVIKGLKSDDQEIIETYPLGRLLNVFLKVCDTIAFAHSKRVIHRDLKPDNRIESVRSHATDDSAKTMQGAVMGTPAFMPPEQAQGDIDNLDERADIYSLGAILYNVLTLQYPVAGKKPMEVLMKVIKGDIVPPAELAAKPDATPLPHCPGNRVPDSLSAVVMKTLAHSKEDRYPQVADLQREIEAYQSGFATTAEQAGTMKQAILFFQRNKVLASAASAVVLALAIGMTIALVQRADAARQKTQETLTDLQSEQAARKEVSERAAPEFVAKAQDLLKQDNPIEAITAIETALGLDPLLDTAWYEKGRLLVDATKFEDSIEAFQHVVETSNDDERKAAAQAYIKIAEKYGKVMQESSEGLLNERIIPLADEVEAHGDHVVAGRLFGRVGENQKGLQIRVLAAIRELEKVNPGLQFKRQEGFATEFGYFYWHHVTKEDGLHIGIPSANDATKLVNIKLR